MIIILSSDNTGFLYAHFQLLEQNANCQTGRYKRGYMSFPVNLLGTDEIVAELKRRKTAEVEELRGKIAEHRSAIRELEARIELSSQRKKRGPKPKA